MPIKEPPRSTSQFITAADGLKLHVRVYGERSFRNLPVVCLSGLARTCADFDAVATALACDPVRPRYVLAPDYRGRGQSDFDSNTDNYSIPVELADLIAVLRGFDIGPAVFIGTSRGGILTMMLAATQPGALAGAVLNDIGPVIETQGMARIKGYVGKLPPAKTIEEGADVLRSMFAAQFPNLTSKDWIAFARRTYTERGGELTLNYDANLARTLDNIDLSRALPPLWAPFEALAGMPLMVIRGANSDILSVKTVDQMRSRQPDITFVEVPDQGHAPLLAEEDVMRRIGDFLGFCDRQR